VRGSRAADAEDFRRAGGRGDISTLPDAAIAESLRQAGLGDVRGSVTFDDPVAYGFPPTSGYADDPVNTATGNFVELETDLRCGGLLEGLSLSRTYNSRSDRAGAFGTGWSSWATSRLRPTPAGAEYEGPDGQRALFPRQGSGYGRVVGVDALVEPLDSGLALAWFGGARWEFDDAGLPVRTRRGPGTAVRLRHDDRGRLAGMVHEAGKHLDLVWADERIVAATCSDGRRVSYGYDDAGDLVEVERSGGVRRYGVGDGGRITSVTDADGVVEVVNAYDDERRVVAQRSPFGRTTRFAYLPGRVTVTSDEDDGPANTYVHDVAGRVLAILDGDEQRMSFQYDGWGNPVVTVQRGGAATIQEWDARGRLVRRVLPTGAQLTFAYDAADRVIEVAASDGAVTRLRYGYDALMRPTTIDDPTGATWRRSYDVDGNMVGSTDPVGTHCSATVDAAGRVTALSDGLTSSAFSFDDLGRAVAHERPDGTRMSCEYDRCGRRVRIDDELGGITGIEYSAGGKVLREVSPSGRIAAREYDRCGRLAARVDGAGRRWEYRYDADGALVERVEPTGEAARYTYDEGGRLAASAEPGHGVTRYERDAAGRTTAIASRAAGARRFGYDAAGRLVTATDANGGVTRYAYDERDRPTTIVDPLGGTSTRRYDAASRLVAETDPLGRTATLTYDAAGRIVERADGSGRATRWSYDASGRINAFWAAGAQPVTITRDVLGRVISTPSPGRSSTICAGIEPAGSSSAAATSS